MGILNRLKSNIAPHARPQLPQESVAKIALALGPYEAGERVRVVAIRGYFRDSVGQIGKNDRGVYDDALFVVDYRRSRLIPKVWAFNGNTDPSVFRRGIASLDPGSYWFSPGKHKIASPLGYPAFRQLSAVRVSRDGGKTESGHFGINIHSGGWNATYSEGCQTLPPSQWEEFRDRVYSSLDVTVEQVKANPSGKRDWRFKFIVTTRADCEALGIKF